MQTTKQNKLLNKNNNNLYNKLSTLIKIKLNISKNY